MIPGKSTIIVSSATDHTGFNGIPLMNLLSVLDFFEESTSFLMKISTTYTFKLYGKITVELLSTEFTYLLYYLSRRLHVQ
jgi:hypothetical protein